MADDVKALSAELAQDPQSLVFLRLGELLRRKGQVEAAQRVAVHGLERHPHLPDAHDLYARILSDARDYARAFDEWDMALQIMPTHAGALKGLAFLYFQVGDLEQAETHLQAALDASPGDASLVQALEVVRGHGAARSAGDTTPGAPSRPPAPAASPPTAGSGGGGGGGGGAVDDARVFAGLEGAEEGLLLLDSAGLVLGGALRDPQGASVTDAVAAYLAGVSQEAARTAKLLGLGEWTGLSAEGRVGHVHLTPPAADSLLLVVRDRAVPMGRLAILAQRAAHAARRWLERQA
jgi:tetratricopeptide (TPR) repeat protein